MTLSGIRHGQRTKQKGQSDLHQLIDLKLYLKRRWHMVFKREWYLGFDTNDRIIAIIDKVPKGTKYKWKNPDLLYIGKEGLIIIEVDGKVHDRKMLKTWERNDLYKDAGAKLIVLNIEEIKSSGKSIYKTLDCRMREILGGDCAEH